MKKQIKKETHGTLLCGKNKRLPEGTKETRGKEIKATGRKKERNKKYNYGMRNHRHKGRKEEKEISKEQIKNNVQDKKDRTKKINNVLYIKWRLVISK